MVREREREKERERESEREGVRKCAGQRVVSGGVGGGDTPDTSTKSQMCNQVCINPGRGLKGLLSPAIWCEVRRGAESDYGRLE